MDQSVAGVILAGGKGTRMNSHTVNKVAVPFNGKPMIAWGVELLEAIVEPIVIVVGAFEHSVHEAVQGHTVTYAKQHEQKGTAHAVQIGIEPLKHNPPRFVIVGYGDHMMFYSRQTVQSLLQKHIETQAHMTLVSAHHDNPDELAYGRVIRDAQGHVATIVEQKDATEEQRKVTELNAGLYCFDYSFLVECLPLVGPSPVSGEYYITELVHIAKEKGHKVMPFAVPFIEMGMGVNSPADLEKSMKLTQHRQTHPPTS